MTTPNSSGRPDDALVLPKSPLRGLRLWPGVLQVVLAWGTKLYAENFMETSMEMFMLALFFPIICALGVALWWIAFSRATATERIIGAVGVLGAMAISIIAGAPGMYMSVGFFGVPVAIAACVFTITWFAKGQPILRTYLATLAGAAPFLALLLVRSDGLQGMTPVFRWRWTPTNEQIFVKKLDEASGGSSKDLDKGWVAPPNAEWPGFRGPNRDGKIPGVTLGEDWVANPPRIVWKHRVGPGWSSFAVAGDRIFTQEQRDKDECVVCYSADTGDELWVLSEDSRFYESMGGPGPRATPSYANGKLYSVGPNGAVQCLDPIDGAIIWRRMLTKDTETTIPQWGYSASPLVYGNHVSVVVGAAPKNGASADMAKQSYAKGLISYHATTGTPEWTATAGTHSYGSAQIFHIGGKPMLVAMTNAGITSVDPETGKTLWDESLPYNGYRCAQPLLFNQTSFLIGTPLGEGTQRIDVMKDGDKYSTERGWLSKDIKPYYSDYVEHKGHLYGFDSDTFVCVELENGKRMWKKDRGAKYGNGQVLLLPDADQLLIAAESGDLVLLRATPSGRQELGKFKVFDDKVWNHGAIVGKRLYIRNSVEAACVELP